MSGGRVDLSIIVVNWNGGAALGACLESAMLATRKVEAEIWLVDNASTDGSAEQAAGAHTQLRVLRNESNLGFARAANQAIERASGEFVLLLNPDARIDEAVVLRMLELMQKEGLIGLAGCGSIDARDRPAPGYEMSYPGQRGTSITQAAGEGKDVAWVSGACLIARRAMMDEIGPLDPEFFMYYEDVDWCYRARQAGWRVVTLSELTIRHDLGGSSAQVPKQQIARRAASSRVRFYRKHYSPASAGWMTARMAASAICGLVLRVGAAAVSRSAREAVSVDLGRLQGALFGGDGSRRDDG